jgi:DNA-3-methyladenine glycosylase II
LISEKVAALSIEDTLPPAALDAARLAQGGAYLCAADPDLARIYAELGLPPLWERPPGFPTLVWIILEQQVSLASARAAYTRLQQALGQITPEAFLQLGDAELKAIGFSRQKTGYCRGLARLIADGALDLERLAEMDDASARAALIGVKGIGAWTADIYLLMCLLRPDIWPAGDLALAAAIQELKGLPSRPDAAEMERLSRPWRPWRAVAARFLWAFYLRERGA